MVAERVVHITMCVFVAFAAPAWTSEDEPTAIRCWLRVTDLRDLQSARITGRVRDRMGRPVAGAEVVVNRREIRSTSGPTGVFSIVVSKGDSTVGFRRIGYKPVILSVWPLPLAADTFDVELEPSAVELPDIILSAPASKPLRYASTSKYDEVFTRMKLGAGSFIGRDDIDRKFAMSTLELLQGVAGVRVTTGNPGIREANQIRFVRCPQPRAIGVYLDGTRLIPQSDDDSPAVEMLSRINPADVEMIEVYRGPSEIPAVYHWDGCAVIAVWTKWNK